MEHLTAALLGPNEWAGSIGKETSNTSFGVGVLKKDDRIITTLYPTKYPEKFWSLLFPMYLSDNIYLSIEKIDKQLGETIIALDLLSKNSGRVHIGDLVDRSMLDSLIKGTVVENYVPTDMDPAVLREELYELPFRNDEGGYTNVVVDQSFHVKGVGCVVLGFVTKGKVSKHQELITSPGGKKTQVRSIQIHDKDHDEAEAGSRVGLAMKNISSEDLPRGTSLSSEGSGIIETERIRAKFRISDHWKGEINEGDHFHLSNSLQFVPVVLENLDFATSGTSRTVEADLVLENRIWIGPGDAFGLCFLDSKSFRLIGAGETI